LRELGDCLVFPVVSAVPDLTELNPEHCHLGWTIVITTHVDENELRDVFIFVEDYSDLEIELLDDGQSEDENADYKRIGEILYERGDLDDHEVRQILAEREPFGAVAANRGLVTKGSVESALEEQNLVRKLREGRREALASNTTRVPNHKLDDLVNLVGELVTLQARLSQSTADDDLRDVGGIAENLELLTSRLRESTMSIRLVPLADTFSSFHRLVRDLSRELGKEIHLTTSGGDTELDKNVIGLLRDPLMHIVRNAVDHGIEQPDERRANDKPVRGEIHIEAEPAGADVLIRVTDDGRGLDSERIHARAVERGLIPPGAHPSRQELYGLIFQPGFSTTTTATDVSGRGVGMDVVKKNVENLSGGVEIDSEVSVGTTVTLRIPLTLAIIDSLLVEIGEERYVVNLSYVDECFILREDPLAGRKATVASRNTGEVLPFVDLRSVLDIPDRGPEIRNAIVVGDDDHKAALVVDRIVGQYQSVIKNLDATLRDIDEVSGSTILGNGRVAFILDVVKILRSIAVTA
jgi:two-component system chemotaxis sensor kinase CheA